MPASRLNQSTKYSSMQASKKHGTSENTRKPYYHPHTTSPIQDVNSYCIPQNFQSVDNRFSDDGSHNMNVASQSQQYFTLDSSKGTCPVTNSPSTVSLSPNSGSPISQQDGQSYPSYEIHQSPDSNNIYGSPISGSCVTDDEFDLRQKLRQLETAMLGPDSDIVDNFERRAMEIPRGDLKQMLIAFARAVAEDDPYMRGALIESLTQMVSVTGDPMQRLGAYLLEGLVARLASSGSAIYKSLKCKEPSSSELLSYMHILYEVCPYFKFGYMSANGAIAEAVRNEDKVHIIDFQIAQGSQWVTLIQALSTRPGGCPKIRITGIDDSVSAYARGGGLHLVGQRLSRFAESCKVPFEFHALDMSGTDVQLEHLKVQQGEALAVNFAFQLHHMPDESVSTSNHRDRLLRLIKGLSPTVVTLVEQESNTNTSPFFPRFLETLDYYTSIFESIDVTLPRDHKERISVEQHCLARDIVNIIACEGAERVERHELFGKWRSRFLMAGFSPYPLSSVVNATIKALLEQYNENYRLEERDGVLYLGWKRRALAVSCAWR